jgi:hypothetical protein
MLGARGSAVLLFGSSCVRAIPALLPRVCVVYVRVPCSESVALCAPERSFCFDAHLHPPAKVSQVPLMLHSFRARRHPRAASGRSGGSDCYWGEVGLGVPGPAGSGDWEGGGRAPTVLPCVVSLPSGRLLGRDRLRAAEDAFCGVAIMGLYFLYLTVTRGALSVFDCTRNSSGVYTLDADPSIRCHQVCGCCGMRAVDSLCLRLAVGMWWHAHRLGY